MQCTKCVQKVSKCGVYNNKKFRFRSKIKEASGLLSSIGIKTSLARIPVIYDILFKRYKMNKIIKNLKVIN